MRCPGPLLQCPFIGKNIPTLVSCTGQRASQRLSLQHLHCRAIIIMPNLPFIKPKGKNTAHSLTGPESSTSLVPHTSEPVRSASPVSMFERLRALGKKPKERVETSNPPVSTLSTPDKAHSTSPCVSSPSPIQPLNPSDPGGQPPSTSPPSVDLSSGSRASASVLNPVPIHTFFGGFTHYLIASRPEQNGA